MAKLNVWQVLKIVLNWVGRKIKQIAMTMLNEFYRFLKWGKRKFKILCKKIIDYVTLLLFGIILFIPLILYVINKKMFNFMTFDEFKELIDIICKSYYIIIMGIIIVVYMFRHSIRKKLEQISEMGNGVVKFALQADINTENKEGTEYSNSTVEEKREDIYDKIKDDVLDIKTNSSIKSVGSIINEGTEILNLEEKLKESNALVRKLKFQNIKLCTAPTTSSLLLYMYNNKNVTFFNKMQLRKLLSDRYPQVNLEIELNAIIYFLTNNKIIETEDDENYSITEFGRKYIEYMFNGGDE